MKADIFSLGTVFQNVWCIWWWCVNYENWIPDLITIAFVFHGIFLDDKQLSSIIVIKYQNAFNLFNDMQNELSWEPTSCDQILNRINSWALNLNAFKISYSLRNIINNEGSKRRFSIYYIMRNQIIFPLKILSDFSIIRFNYFENEFYWITEINSGSFGKCMKAKDKFDNQTYAMKVVDWQSDQYMLS